MVSHTSADRVAATRHSGDSAMDDDTPAVGEHSAADNQLSSGSVAVRRRWLIVAVSVLCLLLLGAVILRMTGPAEPSAPLGASAAIDGGVARINGVIPLETDGWMPVEPASELNGAIQPGTHRRLPCQAYQRDARRADTRCRNVVFCTRRHRANPHCPANAPSRLNARTRESSSIRCNWKTPA
jgi:hypothetical protein